MTAPMTFLLTSQWWAIGQRPPTPPGTPRPLLPPDAGHGNWLLIGLILAVAVIAVAAAVALLVTRWTADRRAKHLGGKPRTSEADKASWHVNGFCT